MDWWNKKKVRSLEATVADLTNRNKALDSALASLLTSIEKEKADKNEKIKWDLTLPGSIAKIQEVSFDLEDYLLALVQIEEYKDHFDSQVYEYGEQALHKLVSLRSALGSSNKTYQAFKVQEKMNEQKDTTNSEE